MNSSCQEMLILDGVQVAPSSSVGLDLIKGDDGTYSLSEEDSNFTSTVLEKEMSVSVTGMLGTQEVKVAFTRTAQLRK